MCIVVGVTDDAFLVNYEDPAEHQRIAGGFPLCVASGHGSRAGGKHLRPHQLQQTAPVEAEGLVGFFGLVGVTGDAWRKRAAVPLGMFWLAQADGGNAQAGRCDLLFVLLQLSKPFAAEYSAKVAQKVEHDRPGLPQLRKFKGPAVNIQHGCVWSVVAHFPPFCHPTSSLFPDVQEFKRARSCDPSYIICSTALIAKEYITLYKDFTARV